MPAAANEPPLSSTVPSLLAYQSQVSTDNSLGQQHQQSHRQHQEHRHSSLLHPLASSSFSIFRSTVHDPFASSSGSTVSTSGTALSPPDPTGKSKSTNRPSDIDRSQSLGGDSAYSLLFKSDRLRRKNKKNLKKENKAKRNSLQIFDTVSIANVASQHQQQQPHSLTSSSTQVSNGLQPAAVVGSSAAGIVSRSTSMLPYNTPTSTTNSMDATAAMAPVGAISMDAHHRGPHE